MLHTCRVAHHMCMPVTLASVLVLYDSLVAQPATCFVSSCSWGGGSNRVSVYSATNPHTAGCPLAGCAGVNNVDSMG
jgi:hypothetical protein